MQELKAEKPIESPEGTSPVERLMDRLREEGFTCEGNEGDWKSYGEVIWRRQEKISFASGETVFIFTATPELNEKILRQTSDAVVNTFKARSPSQKALSVLQSTTVFHVLVSEGDQPHNDPLSQYVTRAGGATFIPVVMVPEINEVIYPDLTDRMGTVRPRVEYLQYLLGERREAVNMHQPTVQAFYIALGVAAFLLIALIISLLVH